MKKGIGLPVFPGVSIGPAVVYHKAQRTLPVSSGDPAVEKAKFDAALETARSQLLLGGYLSGIKLGLLDGGIAGGDRQGALGLAVNNGGTDGHTGEYGKTNTSFHIRLLTCPAR